MEVKLETEKDRPRMGEDKRLGYAQARDPRPGKVLLRNLIIFHPWPILVSVVRLFPPTQTPTPTQPSAFALIGGWFVF